MRYDARKETYELIEVKGEAALFVDWRLDRDTIPAGLYCYEVRSDDDGQGIPCEIAPRILVNHFGTIIMKHELPMPEGYYLLQDDDFNYLGESGITLDEFIQRDI